MKNIAMNVLICFLAFPAFGQEIESSHKDKTYKSIYLELLGASNMIGVSNKARFSFRLSCRNILLLWDELQFL